MNEPKGSRRFVYNQGVYEIRKLEGEDWVSAYPLTAGALHRVEKVLSDLKREQPEAVYALFHLEHQTDGTIDWIRTTVDRSYHSAHRKDILRIFHQLDLMLNDQGYTAFSNIIGISKSAIEKLIRNPYDSRFQALSPEGLIYIQYRVQEYLKDKRG